MKTTNTPIWPVGALFSFGQRVRKKRGSQWQGRICGFYITENTPIGYAVESEREIGSVQVWPEAAVELVPDEKPPEGLFYVLIPTRDTEEELVEFSRELRSLNLNDGVHDSHMDPDGSGMLRVGFLTEKAAIAFKLRWG